MNRKETKNRFVELTKELLTIQESLPPSDFLRSRIKVLTQGIENESLDYEKGMTYILVNAKKAKRPQSIAVWAKVIKAFKSYFEDTK